MKPKKQLEEQERNELTVENWMVTYQQQYLELAKKLGLIDRKLPEVKEFDACWIAGASRLGLWSRIIDYINTSKSYGITVKNNNVAILAGARELWAEIDGIAPAVKQQLILAYQNDADLDTIDLAERDKLEDLKEGKEYLLSLAKLYNIEINTNNPFVTFNPQKTYINYKDQPKLQPRITETLMAQELLKKQIRNTDNMYVIDSQGVKGYRPTTASTVQAATEIMVEHIMTGNYKHQKEFLILLQTNNPYIERQTLSAQLAVNEVLTKSNLATAGYKITIIGAGFKCKQNVEVINSELGALVTEKWKNAKKQSSGKRDINQLLFNTRDNSYDKIPAPPKVNYSSLSSPKF